MRKETRPVARMRHIDALRGIASFAVCWFHLTNGYPSDSVVGESGRYGWLGVEMFFVISGFVIPLSMHASGYRPFDHWGRFLLKRIVRIDPPYLIAAVMALALLVASANSPWFHGEKPDITAAQVLMHLGYLNGILGQPWLNVVFWTLAIEFQYYLLISMVFPLFSATRFGYRALALALSLLSALVFPSENFVFLYLGLFLMGILAFQRSANLIGWPEFCAFLSLVSASAWLSLGAPKAAVGMLAVWAILFAAWLGRSRVLGWLGAVSYSLYLVHVPIGGRVVNIGARFVGDEVGRALLSIAALALCLLSAMVFYRLVEAPSKTMAAKIEY